MTSRLWCATVVLVTLAGLCPAAEPTHKVPKAVEAKLFGMRGFPAVASEAELATLFPLIDALGQYGHKDWPGKTRSADDLVRQRQEEAAELARQPSPAEWDEYGGWSGGPKLAATGHFRTEKWQSKWWLVDPVGRLFWSHGIDCVGTEGSTPITDRQSWFAELPKSDSPLAAFYGKGSWAPHGYYKGKTYETYNFFAANVSRKYGPTWKSGFAETCHRRLRSWGMNTIANWSDAAIYGLNKTPYVVTVHAAGRQLEGSTGYWGKFADVFDADFGKGLRKELNHRAAAVASPWCLGVFVDNELSWGDDFSLAIAALQSPADQPAKRAFVDDLTKKYPAIERLNAAWGTKYASFDALLKSRAAPDKTKAAEDLKTFATRTAEQYFRVCRDAVKKASPDTLYLGCRFAWVNPLAVRAAGKFCDVVSFNFYKTSIRDFQLPSGVDKPVLVGEFHFGALDRGMFHTGLVPVDNQQARAAAYQAYVRGAVEHPLIVGTHWFQFGDQATTGRGDGENYQIGFVDVCDRPYPETIDASRAVGAAMYHERAK